MSYPVYTTATHLLVTYSSRWTRVTESGDAGAAFALLLFLAGAGVATHGLFNGIEQAVSKA